MDYDGIFAVFNEHNDTHTGTPHPLAALRMTAAKWETEQRLPRPSGPQRSRRSLARPHSPR